MGGPAPTPVSEETQAAVDAAAPNTLEQVAEESSDETFSATWYAIRKAGTRDYLGEMKNINGQPYDTAAGWSAFGPRTYFYALADDAEGVLETFAGGQIVPVSISATIG